MPLNLASPGLVVREVALTIGRVDTATTKAGAIVAPFQKGQSMSLLQLRTNKT